MDALVAATLAALVGLPPAYVDRAEPGRRDRMAVIARAIGDASSRASCTGKFDRPICKRIWGGQPRELAALLVTMGWRESRFLKNVHEGNCRRWECDATKLKNGRIVFRARSPWQLQRTSIVREQWDAMLGAGFKPTRNAAWAAAKVLSRPWRRCETTECAVAGAVRAWNRGRGAGPALLLWRKLMRRWGDAAEVQRDPGRK